jgi:GAF domain-containing protein/sensor histidine kinase YesM
MSELAEGPATLARPGTDAPARPRGRLFRKYVLLFVGLVSLVLIVNAAIDFWFSWREDMATASDLLQTKANSAARRIEAFVDMIEKQIGWTTNAEWAASPLDQRRFDFVRLLRQVPAITEVAQLDGQGREQLKVSRLAMDVVGSQADHSRDPGFIGARKDRVWFGPVYFRKQSEPYMTIAVRSAGRNGGVTVAEVNLKLIWDVVTALKIGEQGDAYVVDGKGRLIADPDISLVLRDTDLSHLPQVAAAHAAPTVPTVTLARSLDGKRVLTAYAPIERLGWLVFVELPQSEALAPLYAAAMRAGALLVLGLALATLAALLLARRMVVPIRAIAAGAARIGMGELDRRISVKTGDEIEDLAGQFNQMAGELQQSYAELEQRVRDRTAELSEALDQQTATAEVLGVINSSPGDLEPVFDAMLERATRVCNADAGILCTYDGEAFHLAAFHGLGEAAEEFPRDPIRPHPEQGIGRIAAGEQIAHILDSAEGQAYETSSSRQQLVALGGARTQLTAALRKDNVLLGSFTIWRREVRAFSEKEITLLQNFSAQAVIAMENARLITETREALEQQTATAEVLGVINSSPGDLAPVFDAMLEKALRLCEAAFGYLSTYDGERFRTVSMVGVPPAFAEFRTQNPPDYGPGTTAARVLAGERIVRVVDLKAEDPYRNGEPNRRALVDLGGARSALCVALAKDDAVLGNFMIYRTEVRPFTDKQVMLLQNFAAQAVIAMENARLITETREALEQQTATAEVLGVINSSPGDLAPVFGAILEKAHALCGAAHGALMTFDGEFFRAAALHDMAEPLASRLREPFRSTPGDVRERLLHGERLIHIPDIHVLDATNPESRAALDAGVRTLLIVPLRKDDALLGYITANRREVRPFTDKQIALLQNFAAQAVIAMENARLITETREALEQQTATAEVLGVINSSPGDLKPVFEAMIERAVRLCNAATGTLRTFDGSLFHLAAVHGEEPVVERLKQLGPIPAAGVLGRIAHGERLVHISDFRETDTYHDYAHARERSEIVGIRTWLAVALQKEGALLGAIIVHRNEVRPFSDKEIALLENFAAQAVIAMENARLITETREALDQQTATAEVLGVINSSPGDLAPVFDAMLEKALRLCEATYGHLAMFDGECFETKALSGDPRVVEWFRELGRFRPPPGSVAERIVEGERVVHVVDAGDDEGYRAGSPLLRTLRDIGGMRSLLAIALRRDEALLGVIVVYRKEVRPFTDKQIALLQNFGAQAVIAMENARLITETREALEQQTATAEVLQVINSSPGDLKPVFDEMVEKATRLCEAAFGILLTYDGERFHHAALRSIPAAYAEFMSEHPPIYGPGTSPGRLAAGERLVHIVDMTDTDSYRSGDQNRRAIADLAGARTLVAVPLRKDRQLLGAIVVFRQEVRPFTDKQIALLQNFAAQAVIAMENARLLGELRERTAELGRSVEELKTLSEVGQAVSSTLDLRSVLSTILGRSVGLTGADAGAIFRHSRAEHAFRLVEAVGWEAGPLRGMRDFKVAENESAMGEAAQRRAPIQLPDLEKRPRFPLRDASVQAGLRSALIVPLVGPERVLGVIVLQRRATGEFPPETVRLMQTLASQSVLAIQNARMFRELAQKSEELELASQHKSQFLANMSHELRTPLNAILGYAELLVDGVYGDLPDKPKGVLERIQNNGRHLLALINDVLDLAKIEAGQLTLSLEDYSVPELVRSVVTATEPLAVAKGLKFAALLPEDMPTAHGDARRISQVLLNLVGNAIKFTDQGEVEIRALAADGHFTLSVRDTGPGIAEADQEKIFGEFQQIDNSNTRKKGGTGLGLAISKRMVEMQGGTISVESAVGEGSIFRVTLPVRVEEAMEAAA